MAAKLILIILSALSGFNSYSKANLVFNVPDHCLADPYNETPIVCSTAKVNIAWTSTTINIACDAESAVTDLKSTFSNMTIDKTFREVLMENCLLPEGESFGELFKHFRIEQENTSFVGKDIGSSVYDRFSSGFENVVHLDLSGNGIHSINESVFEKMRKLSELDLSHNKIQELPENVLKSLSELKILDLTRNKLKSLSDGIFTNQTQLIELYMGRNALVNLTKDTFKGLASLEVLGLCENEIIKLTDDVFHNIPKLHTICLGYDRLNISYNIFAHNSQLKKVYLQRVEVANGLNLTGLELELLDIKNSQLVSITGLSHIESVSITGSAHLYLASNLFENQTEMRNLDLSSNELTYLPDGLFYGLEELTHLKLSDNQLTNISGLLFQDLRSLIEIDLSGNHLSTIHSNAFARTLQLTTINLQNNRLRFRNADRQQTLTENYFPSFKHLNKLRTLNLSNNTLSNVPSDLLKRKDLREVNLGFNQISSLKYEEMRKASNSIQKTLKLPNSVLSIYLNGNPLECDCIIHKFLSKKAESGNLSQFNTVLLDTIEHICDLSAGHDCRKSESSNETIASCPGFCKCTDVRQSADRVERFINCDGVVLKKFPEIESATSISLSNSSLTELPNFRFTSGLIVIQASHNKISNIRQENLPSGLRILDVSHNHIRTISADIVKLLRNHQNLEMFFFKQNSFLCDCTQATKDFIAFYKQDNWTTDIEGEKCEVSSMFWRTSAYELSSDFIDGHCSTKYYIHLLIGFAMLPILVAISIVLFLKHQQFIKVWLYAHNACLWWVDEDHLDKDKVYDAFISYSQLDGEYVHGFVTELENGSPSFKLCVHERDFLGGEDIEKSIIKSVDTSRRTIVILSKNFLQSVWATHEFHLAYHKSIEEKRNRLIVVKLGDIGDITSVDSIIQSYVKTHTYIDSNDRWFWEKIRYALPHRNRNRNRKNISS